MPERPIILLPQRRGSTAPFFENVAAENGLMTVRREPSLSSIHPRAGSRETYIVWVRNLLDRSAFELIHAAGESGSRVGALSLTDVGKVRERVLTLGGHGCFMDEVEFSDVMSWLKDEEAQKEWLRRRRNQSRAGLSQFSWD
jgi:hypothetical protein